MHKVRCPKCGKDNYTASPHIATACWNCGFKFAAEEEKASKPPPKKPEKPSREKSSEEDK